MLLTHCKITLAACTLQKIQNFEFFAGISAAIVLQFKIIND